MVSSDGFLSNMVSREQLHSQRTLEILFLHRILPQNDRNAWKGSLGMTSSKRTLTSAWKKLWSESVVKCDIEESETVPCGAYIQRYVSFAKIWGLGVYSNDIDELVEVHSQELTPKTL
ncbi:hypothetical protein AVEN_61582-1 [Araneus ventricosus]|uniref:Uncharacterized protein n=1 Tax=Araneus ventricosus TaxID=182803 RepID=A0A4Y2SG40_ARAVE|nr:hypothetical protein AVEN_61582-1 [Araneus ventricosus]